MKITIQRKWLSPTSTCGILAVDGDEYWVKPVEGHSQGFCYTLERQLFQDGMEKPYAIPEGTYEVKLLWSDHFHMVMPHLIDVPGFEAIEWHDGNWPSDVRGCAAVGSEHQENNIDPKTGRPGGAVFGSKVMLAVLIEKLKTVTDKIFVTYSSQGEAQ